MKYRINNVNTNPRIPLFIEFSDDADTYEVYPQRGFGIFFDLSAFKKNDKVDNLILTLKLEPVNASSLSFILKAKEENSNYTAIEYSDLGNTIDQKEITLSTQTSVSFDITKYIQDASTDAQEDVATVISEKLTELINAAKYKIIY